MQTACSQNYFGLDSQSLELCFNFFILFSRFEYALKRAGFYKKPSGKERPLEVCWDKAGNSLDPQCGKSIKEFCSKKSYMFENPPQKLMVYPDGKIKWVLQNTVSMNETRRALHIASSVRNNLFHGGKWPDEPRADIARDKKLIQDSIDIIKLILNSTTEVKKYFDEPIGTIEK